MEKKSILILGAGFGGIAAAKALLSKKKFVYGCDVTVIDREPHHLFTPLLYEAATAFFEHENIGSERLLKSGVVLDARQLLRRWGANFLCADAAGVDWQNRRVLVRAGEPVPFDYLIIALGADTNFFGIPGMQERAYTLKSARDAERLRQRVRDVLHKREKGIERTMDICIGGAGATGVEFAAELTMFLRKHMLKGHLKPEDFVMSLVEARNRILPMFDEKISRWAEERLRSLGVKLFLDTCIKEVKAHDVTLSPRPLKAGEAPDQLVCDFRGETQKVIEADIVVWTGGIRGSTSLERLGVPLDTLGKRIEVGANLEVPGRKDVFAIGDAALLMNPKTKSPAPWLAQAAMEQAKCVAATIVNRLTGQPDAQYAFPSFPTAVPLGGKYAAVHIGRLKLRGFPAWLVRELADLRYFMTILPFWEAVGHWWGGVRLYGQND